MAIKIQEPEISPKQALTNIRKRLYKAVEEGKRKAGLPAKTEAVFEGVDDDDELDFSTMETGDSQPDDAGDELDFSQMTTEENEPAVPAEAKVPPKTFAINKPKKVSREERLLSERRSRELKRQLNTEFNFSVAEIKEIVTGLFRYASENREYLQDAGPLITEPELRAIFHAEFQNYGSDTLKDTTKAALKHVEDIAEKQMGWLRERFDERLHGNGNFLENGSLMGYLLRIGHKHVVRTAQVASGNSIEVGGVEGLHNFIIAHDLAACERWVKSKTAGYDLPESARHGIAMDILTNGMSKPEIRKLVGGIGSKMYSVPRYGSVERLGEDVAVLGGKAFIDEFVTRFAAFLKTKDGVDAMRPEIEPAVNTHGKEYGHGMMMARYPETPYLGFINEAVDAGIFLPIRFAVGSTSLEGDGTENKDGSRLSDIYQTHQVKDTVESNDYSVGEQISTDNMLETIAKPAFKKLVERLGLESEYANATGDGTHTLSSLSALTSALIAEACKKSGVPFEKKETQSISTVSIGTDRSLPKLATEKIGITPPEQSALLAAVTFNGFLEDRAKNISQGHDVSDIKDMNRFELKNAAMPSIFTGKLAEACLSGYFDYPATVNYAKGYLVDALGTVVGFDHSDRQIFSSAADYCNAAGIPPITGRVIKSEIRSLGASSLPAYADIFERKAASGLNEDDDVDVSFYDEGRSVELSNLGKSGIAMAIGEITPDNVDGADVIKRAAETVTGLEAGFLGKYMDALNAGDSETVEAMARDIIKSGKGIVTVKMTDTGSEKVKRNAAAATKKKADAERRKARRTMWF